MTATRTRLIAAHKAAAEHYVEALHGTEGDGPRAYLAERGLSHVLEDPAWIIGYARPAWTELLNHLRQQGFKEEEISASGLALSTRRNTLVDRFRDRIVFGLRAHVGDAPLVGFIGRCPPHASPSVPKYLNSPHTDLFDKSSVLFGFSEQHSELQSGAIPVVVEGPLDVLAIRTLDGPFVAVSPCGTRLSAKHATSLSLTCETDRVVLANDADAAGHDGTRHAYKRLNPGFQNVLAARFPPAQDPASVAKQDLPALNWALRAAEPAADLIVDQTLKPYLAKLDNAEARVCALHAATREIAHLGTMDVSRQVARVSERLEFPTATVTQDVLDALSRVSLPPHVRRRAAYPQPTFLTSATAPTPSSPRMSRKEFL